MRDYQGRFIKGNKCAKKPLKCPFCNKIIEPVVYVYIPKNIENSPLENREVEPEEAKKEEIREKVVFDGN